MMTNNQYVCLLLVMLFFGYTNSAAAFVGPSKQPINERVFVHTGRDIYIAGEYMHFTAHLFNNAADAQLQSRYIYMSLKNQWQEVVDRVIIDQRDNYATGALYLEDTLSTGYYELVAHTNWMRNEGEACFFRKSLLVVNRFDEHPEQVISRASVPVGSPADREPAYGDEDPDPGCGGILIHTEQEVYGLREKINITLDGSAMEHPYATLTLSVVNEELLGSRRLSACDYLSENDPVKKEMPAGGNQPDYFMETEGLIISGALTDAITGMPVSDARIILNTPDTIVSILYATTNDHGIFHLVLPEYHYDRELYFLTDHQTVDGEVIIKLSDKFDPLADRAPVPFPVSEQQLEAIRKSQDIVSVDKNYRIDHMKRDTILAEPAGCPPLLFSEPRQTVYPGRYVDLDSLPEISRELVHAWRMRYRDGQYISQLACADTGNRLPGTPVYFLDGIATYDVEKLIHLKSEDIGKIQVHNYNWVYGSMRFPGILGIFTENHDYLSTLAHRTRSDIIRESLPGSFVYVPPSYEENKRKDDHRSPDLRQLLCWHGGIEMKRGATKTLHTYSGDLRGKYTIMVQGVTPDGNPLCVRKTIEIK